MKIKKVHEFAQVLTGGTPSTEISEYWDNGTIPWLQSGCCQNCYVNKASKYITQKGYDNSVTKLMPKDTVLIALTGATAGKVGYLTFEACGNQSITGILPNDVVIPKFLFYFLQFKRNKILADCVGGAQPHISQAYVKNIEVPVYSVKEQEIIVKQLELINDLIIKNKENVNALDELIKSQFIEMFGNYDKTELSNIAEIIMGQSPESKSYNDNGEGVPFFQGKADYGEKYTIVKRWTTNPTKTARKNSVLMSVRAPVGPVNIANVDCCIGRGLCSIDSLKGKTNNEFLYNALKVMESDIALLGSGSTFKAINKNDIYNLMLPNAPLDLQNEFSLFAQQIDKSKFLIKRQIELLEELLTKKMDEYFK